MSNEIWCVVKKDDTGESWLPVFFNSNSMAVAYMLKDLNADIALDEPFDIRINQYSAVLETNDFSHWWNIYNVTKQIEDLQK